METTTETKKSNDLRFRTTKIVGNKSITVNISLNDECKNGHQDFAITGDIYEAHKPKTDRYYISGGCIHEEIEKHFPEYIPFIKLHLCDYKGIPMHASANGYYHLRTGFNSKSKGEAFKKEYCEYYRVSPDQFNELNKAENELQFSLMLQSLGILNQWEVEANKAIKQLETLTGMEFVVDSKKTQYYAPTEAQIEEENKKQASGYYTEDAKNKRKQEAIDKQFAELLQERDEKIKKINDEYEVKRSVLSAGGKRALENSIFYNHTNTLSFNWRKYWDGLTPEEINNIISKITLPEGVKIETKH